METEQSYQVGDLHHFKAEDPEFNTIAECFKFVIEEYDPDHNGTYGVWTGQKQGSELVGIVHEGQYFKAY